MRLSFTHRLSALRIRPPYRRVRPVEEQTRAGCCKNTSFSISLSSPLTAAPLVHCESVRRLLRVCRGQRAPQRDRFKLFSVMFIPVPWSECLPWAVMSHCRENEESAQNGEPAQKQFYLNIRICVQRTLTTSRGSGDDTRLHSSTTAASSFASFCEWIP